MIKSLISSIILLLWASSLAQCGFAIFQVSSTNQAAAVCNFQTGLTGTGATCVSSLPTCNGIANDTASFDAFATWAVASSFNSGAGQLIELLIPPGLNCQNSSTNQQFLGIKKLLVVGTGSQLGGNYFHLGGGGQINNNLHSTRLMAVSAGATTLTVNPGSSSQPAACSTNTTCVNLFTVGDWALLTGFDLQRGIGYPSNPFYFEYVLVTAKNTAAGTVTISTPTVNTYKTTWPNYGVGSGIGVDAGGPATLYALQSEWNTEVEWRGLTFTTTNQTYANGRQIVFRNVTWTFSGQGCVIPSQNLSFQIINSTMTGCDLEVDKLFTSATITNSVLDSLSFQSASWGTSVSISGSTIRAITGTPFALTISGASAITSLDAGAGTYGYTRSVAITGGTTMGNIPSGANPGGFSYQGKDGEGFQNITGITMSGGVITIPNSYIIGSGTFAEANVAWMAPGGNVCWSDTTYACATVFQIIDVTQDATNTYVAISQSGGLPSWTYAGGKLAVRVHPAVQFTCATACGGFVGSPDASPMWSYTSNIFANANGGGYNSYLWGNISTITANVTAAYGGATSPANDNIRPNDAISPSTYAANNYTSPLVNLKVTGARTLDTTGGFPAVWGNVKSGDTLPNLTSQTWVTNLWDNILTNLSGDPGNPFSITVTATTNQGVVVP